MKPYFIGLLGGIGPLATGAFYDLLISKIQQRAQIRSNTDYPKIIINSVPAPALTSSVVEDDDLQSYIDGVMLLRDLKPDLIFMICNTVHVFFDRIRREVGVPSLLSIQECARERLMSQYVGRTICVLGTPLTVSSGLYEVPRLHYSNPTPEELKQLGMAIDGYSASGDPLVVHELLQAIILKKQHEGVELFLSACTEISLLVQRMNTVSILDTMDIASDYIVSSFLEHRKKRP